MGAMKDSARSPAQIGALVRRARRLKHLSQKALGERVGLRQATISKLEKGEPATQLKTLLDVLAALDLELALTERRHLSQDELEELL